MIPLSNNTQKLVMRIVPNEFQEKVIKLLENECADNLPFLEDSTPESIERFRFAVLKIGKRNLSKIETAIDLAKQDWRDLLVAAKFANSVETHKLWSKNKYKIG